MDTSKAKEYARLRRMQEANEAEAKAIKEQADALERELIEEFSEEGLQNLRVDGQTVYLRRDLYAQRTPGVEPDALIEGLKAAGLEHFVKPAVNMNSLSAYLRDLDRDEQEIPEELAPVLQAHEKYSIRVTKG